jgi:hypothetical protein
MSASRSNVRRVAASFDVGAGEDLVLSFSDAGWIAGARIEWNGPPALAERLAERGEPVFR